MASEDEDVWEKEFKSFHPADRVTGSKILNRKHFEFIGLFWRFFNFNFFICIFLFYNNLQRIKYQEESLDKQRSYFHVMQYVFLLLHSHLTL